MEQLIRTIAILFLCSFLAACSLGRPLSFQANSAQSVTNSPAQSLQLLDGTRFLREGKILLSRPIPKTSQVTVDFAREDAGSEEYAPLLGYLPPSGGFLPAQNETWIEINSTNKVIQIFKGQTAVKTIQAEGVVPLQPGTYALQHKQKRPLWYAPDDYFTRRQQTVPPPGDRERYRRGALGQFALYPAVTFPIHSGPVWTEDVGGLRVSKADLSSIYYIVPIGTQVRVK